MKAEVVAIYTNYFLSTRHKLKYVAVADKFKYLIKELVKELYK